MRLCEFRPSGAGPGARRLGIVEGGEVYAARGFETMADYILSGAWPKLPEGEGAALELASVSLLAPVPRPGKIVAAIVNTQAMLGGDIRLDRPRLDMKAPSAVVGPGDTIASQGLGIRPEVELAAVVGRRITKASPEAAKSCLMGFMILNDVTAPSDSREDAYEAYRRDRSSGEIRRSTMRGPLFRSKNHDTFCPTGPWMVTSDELGDTSGLRMSTKFDGMLVQTGSTSEYIFAPERIASYVSGFLSLDPGDVVSCGSVGWAPEALGSLDPTEFVLPRRAGTLELEIERIGTLRNPVV